VPTLFWPNLATFHYSKKSLKWYGQNGVEFLPKKANLSKCPEQQAIKSYWSITK
jgi:hypothetical protein